MLILESTMTPLKLVAVMFVSGVVMLGPPDSARPAAYAAQALLATVTTNVLESEGPSSASPTVTVTV